MIEFKNISKAYKNKVLFQKLNLLLSNGKKIYIKGMNGSGKSVLLKLIVGYSKPSAGSIVVDGITIGKERDFIPNAGVSINAPEFIKNLTGLENLMELAAIRKIATKESILALADYLDFKVDIMKKYATFSLGMKQKMRIMQAIMDQPKYLILDEPFDALDKSSKEKVMSMLNQYIKADKERYFIFTSHDESLDSFADMIYVIEDTEIALKKSAE